MLSQIKSLLPVQFRTAVIDHFYQTSPCCYSNRYLNLAGMNILRVSYFRVKYLLRRTEKPISEWEPYAETLQRDGVLKIENFLAPEEFDALVAEYESLYDRFRESKNITVPVQRRFFVAKRSLMTTPGLGSEAVACKRSLVENKKLQYIIHRVSRRKIRTAPTTAFSEEYYEAGDIGKNSENKTVMPHYDVPYPSFKAFLYLNDIDESNGAFHFAPGSHRFNFRRLILEYFTALNISSKRYPQVNYADSKYFAPYRDAMQPITGKKNTLVIFNAMGIHQRGQFQTTEPRQMVQLCYR